MDRASCRRYGIKTFLGLRVMDRNKFAGLLGEREARMAISVVWFRGEMLAAGKSRTNGVYIFSNC